MSELHRQQQWMWENKEVRIDDKIVSLNQPHIRPIVRGKGEKKQNLELNYLQVVSTDMYFYTE